MAFTSDWDESLPVDHTLISQGPAKIRNVRVDVGDRLATIISGFVSGETVVGILNLPFIAVSAPSTVADQIQVYGKVVSTKTELHAKDEDGNEFQITSGGKLNTLALKATAVADLVNLLPYIYPVGSVLTFGVSTNPATLLGFGTWTAIAGKVIVGLDSGDTDFDTVNETGGAKTVNLAHAHSGSSVGNASIQGGSTASPSTGINIGDQDRQHTHALTIASDLSATQSVLQPYIVKYVWERTA